MKNFCTDIEYKAKMRGLSKVNRVETYSKNFCTDIQYKAEMRGLSKVNRSETYSKDFCTDLQETAIMRELLEVDSVEIVETVETICKSYNCSSDNINKIIEIINEYKDDDDIDEINIYI